MLNTSFTYVGKDLHIQRYVVHKIHIYMYVICSCTCVCDEQYLNDYNNTTQHGKKFKHHTPIYKCIKYTYICMLSTKYGNTNPLIHI